jgi:dihydroneopterin aldolase
MKMIMQLKEFSYFVKLGYSEAERCFPQEVKISIDFEYSEAPQVCYSDSIEDTICYANLNTKLVETIEKQEFKTIEYLAFQVLNLTLSLCPPNLQVIIKVHKVNPPIARFTQGVVIELKGNT